MIFRKSTRQRLCGLVICNLLSGFSVLRNLKFEICEGTNTHPSSFFDPPLYNLQHFAFLRVASRLVFGINQLAIGEHVEDPTARRDQLDRLDDVPLPHRSSQTAHQLFRQTGGIRGVVSLHAENDPDAHGTSLLILDLVFSAQCC